MARAGGTHQLFSAGALLTPTLPPGLHPPHLLLLPSGAQPPHQPTRLREWAGQLQAPRVANTTPTASPDKSTAWVFLNAASCEPCWWTSHITPHVDSCCGLTGHIEMCCPSDPHNSAVNVSPSPPAAGQLWGLPCFAGLSSPSRGSQPACRSGCCLVPVCG